MAFVAGDSGGISVLRGRLSALTLHERTTPRGGAVAEDRFQIDEVAGVWCGNCVLTGDEGDDLVAAGYFKGSEFLVMAWWNVSKNVGGHQDAWGFWLGAGFVAAGGFLLADMFLRHRLALTRLAFTAGLVLWFGLVMMRSSVTTQRSIRLVQRVRDDSSGR